MVQIWDPRHCRTGWTPVLGSLYAWGAQLPNNFDNKPMDLTHSLLALFKPSRLWFVQVHVVSTHVHTKTPYKHERGDCYLWTYPSSRPKIHVLQGFDIHGSHGWPKIEDGGSTKIKDRAGAILGTLTLLITFAVTNLTTSLSPNHSSCLLLRLRMEA